MPPVCKLKFTSVCRSSPHRALESSLGRVPRASDLMRLPPLSRTSRSRNHALQSCHLCISDAGEMDGSGTAASTASAHLAHSTHYLASFAGGLVVEFTRALFYSSALQYAERSWTVTVRPINMKCWKLSTACCKTYIFMDQLEKQ